MINQNTSHDLFFEPTKVSDFPSVLESVQKYISQNYASLLLEKDKDEVKTQIMFQIQKYPELYINKEGKWSETKIYNAIGKFIDKTGGLPMVSDFRPSNELPSLKTFVKYCGTGTME